MHLSTIRPKILFGIITLKVFKKCKNIGPNVNNGNVKSPVFVVFLE